MNTVYIVFERADKSCDSEILGVYETKEEAVDFLLGYITDDHDPSVCNEDGCDLCETYEYVQSDLQSENKAEDTYEIIEMEVGKKWYI